jgi:hypothetical protein
MIQIQDVLVSEDLFIQSFACDLGKCKGACCVEGESGAPVEESEREALEKIQDAVRPYLRAEGIAALEEQGPYVRDADGDLVTPLRGGKECAYTVFDARGIAKCGIEQAFRDGKIDFMKPSSCHLYPIRITKVGGMDALNYHQWPICEPAKKCGKDLSLPMFRFLKNALERKYGKEWFAELESTYELWKSIRGQV